MSNYVSVEPGDHVKDRLDGLRPRKVDYVTEEEIYFTDGGCMGRDEPEHGDVLTESEVHECPPVNV